MKNSHTFTAALISLSFILLLGSKTTFAEVSKPRAIQAEFGTGYIPEGFDTNDNIQIVAEGMFPNLCFRPGSVKVSIDQVKRQVTLLPSALEYSGPCLQVVLPWDRVIDLGILKSGEYTVIQPSRDITNRTLGRLKVHAATMAGADDFLYAPVSQAFYESKNGKKTLKITGEFTNSCLKLVDVVANLQPKVVVIQPISEMDESATCQTGKFVFEKIIELPKMTEGRYLIHVRSSNGKSINNLVDID